MHGHPHLQWIRPARQARSQQTHERLLDSAEALITDKGFADVSVAQIAERAGFSVGAVYSRFRDKQGVLHCLQDRFVEEAHLTTDAAFDPELWDDASIEEIVSELMVFLVEIHRERRGVLRELSVRMREDEPNIERRERLVAHINDRVIALLLRERERIRHPDPAVAIAFGLRFVLATLEQAILYRGVGAHGIPSSDEKLAAELTRAFLGYLDLDGATTPANSPAE